MSIFSFPVFSSQFNLNNTDGEVNNKIIPIMITSIDKIINTFIIKYFVDIPSLLKQSLKY